MEHSELKDTSQCVRVAVNVRPLVRSELQEGCTDCITVAPGDPQVQIGSHSFTFDYVFGSRGFPSSRIYDECAAPLVDALFQGYNGTVLAYGQTGSGKTYTMGTNYSGEEQSGGVIPKVMETIFSRVEASRDSTEFLIRVSFIEIFKEEVFDLLDCNSPSSTKVDGFHTKPAAPTKAPIQIRETVHGGITLAGVTEAEVRTKEEMASLLLRGSVVRATGTTNMNSQSSRSHAIFTISVEQKRTACHQNNVAIDDVGDDILSAKLHLVDLAGSERAKRTGANGMRFLEGIHINKGLLALGNVISALGDEKKRKEGGHIPYRDSKLTRLLQDSLGGNSKTVMIACVSPADTNAEETLNTLKYANRARNIQNKAIINRDPMAAQVQRMRTQIEQLQAELLYTRGESGGAAPFEEVQMLKHKVSLLEVSNAELQRELHERRVRCEHLTQKVVDAQVEKDRLILKIESARNGKSWEEIESNSEQDTDLVKTYVSKIQELEGKVLRMKNSSSLKCSGFADCLELNADDLTAFDTKNADLNSENEVDEKELEHSSLQEKLDMELKELDKKLEQKEAEMKRFSNVDTSVLKNHYEKKVQDLEQEKRNLQGEIEQLRLNLANISSTSNGSSQKLKEEYLQKLNSLESQVSELKKKQDAQAQLLRQKQKSDEAAKRLQDDIHRIKTQKVQLQQKIKQESEQFRVWKACREKEVLQLKKEGRRNEYEMHKLLALNQRQKMVLHRKTEEAASATKRLKELLESRKVSSRDTSGTGSNKSNGLQALMQAIEHELEVTVRVHEVRCEYERQMEERSKMGKEIAELKEEAQIAKHQSLRNGHPMMSPGARNSRIYALENMLATSSSTLVSMASQLSEAEEREKAFNGRGRWNQVRTIAEAKNVMNYLYNLASSSRCQLWDRETECKERHAEIRDVKEKVVSLFRQIEIQKVELISTKKKLKKMKHLRANNKHRVSFKPIDEVHIYDTLPKRNRSSVVVIEDMDTSESEHSYESDDNETVSGSEYAPSDTSAEESELSVCEKPPKRSQMSKSQIQPPPTPIILSDTEFSRTTEASGCATVEKNTFETCCCTCSKYSLCKTNKCECRVVGNGCGPSCGCAANKCSNRQAGPADGVGGGGLFVDENDKKDMASQGAMLLQSALSHKPVETADGPATARKPLSDIGNTAAKSNAPKTNNQRKKWKKSSIQLVPVVVPPPPPPPNSQTEPSGEAAVNSESIETTTNIALGLSRAMRSASGFSSNNHNNNQLRDRNSDQTNHSAVNKETNDSSSAPKSTNGKENQGV